MTGRVLGTPVTGPASVAKGLGVRPLLVADNTGNVSERIYLAVTLCPCLRTNTSSNKPADKAASDRFIHITFTSYEPRPFRVQYDVGADEHLISRSAVAEAFPNTPLTAVPVHLRALRGAGTHVIRTMGIVELCVTHGSYSFLD